MKKVVSNKKNLLSLVSTIVILVAIPITVYVVLNAREPSSKASGSVVRGQAGDLWADNILGKRDFTEISAGKIVPNKTNRAGGIVVDQARKRAYIQDGVNSRILGIDLNNCLATPAPTTCSADPSAGGIVIGQSSATDRGACNGDSSFQTYPTRAPASASTICAMNEGTRSTAEILPFVQMAVDSSGRLIYPDNENHRVLIYDNPFVNNAAANQVIGQLNSNGQQDFSGNLCNGGNTNAPTASTLCFAISGSYQGSAVAIEPGTGNLWVVDSLNNRVLRFPKDPNSPGHYLTTANLVLGQVDFTHGYEAAGQGSGPAQFNTPNSLTFGPSGELYVNDSGNSRIQVFNTPFASSMNATRTFSGTFNGWISAVEPNNSGFWYSNNIGGTASLWSWSGSLLRTLATGDSGIGGGMGIYLNSSGQENVFLNLYIGRNNIGLYTNVTGDKAVPDRYLFLGTNQGYENTRLGDGAGIALAGNQMFVSDNRRVLFWTNPLAAAKGQAADGCLVQISCTTWDANLTGYIGQIKADASNRVWVRSSKDVKVYQAPVTSGAAPIKTINYPLNVLGGGQITLLNDRDGSGIVPTSDGKFLWFTETNRSRILRIRDPLTNPMVDLVLGQTDLTGTQCNRGLPSAGPDTVCNPGDLSIDRKGNLYVSDSSLELSGSFRLLMFASGKFPTNNTSVIFAPSDTAYDATKIFLPNAVPGYQFAPWEPAFDSNNRMVLGLNAYLSGYFVVYYDDPTDPTKTTPDGALRDFNPDTLGATFDQNDNLYLANHNRGRVLIYKTPFVEPVGNAPPVVTVTSHQNGGWYSGRQTFVASVADDYNSTARVEIYVDGTLSKTFYYPPYSLIWDPPNYGPHTLLVKAYDNFGKMGQTSITVNIDGQGPNINLFNGPANGATVSGSVPVSARVEDVVSAVAKVEFYVDGNLAKTDTTNDSYGFWWDTTSVGNGSHTLTEKGYDLAGNITSAAPRTVTVDNTGYTPPPNYGTPVTLNPNANGAISEWTQITSYPTGQPAWQAVNEEVSDEDLSSIFDNSTNSRKRQTLKIDTSSVPANSVVGNVQIFARAKLVGGTLTSMKLLLNGTAVNAGSQIDLTNLNYQTYSSLWATNPETGQAWKVSDLSNFEIGVQSWLGTAGALRVSEVWAVVNINPPVQKAGDYDGNGSVGIGDLNVLVNTWKSTTDLRADGNGNNVIDIGDLSVLVNFWGT